MERLKDAYVYKHIRLDTGAVFYVGIGKERWKRHDSIKNRNIHWKRVTAKTEYRVEIDLTGLTWAQACEREKVLILFYGRRDLRTGSLVNMTEGGEGTPGRLTSEKTRKIIGQKSSLKTYSPEYKTKLKAAQSNRIKQPNKGMKFSEETRKRMSVSGKGRVFSEEHKQKIAEKTTAYWKNKKQCLE